jgi:hypothetical protein
MLTNHNEDALVLKFNSCLDQTPVKTSRYLWHITENNETTNLYIAAKGLVARKNYAVFAHNNIYKFNYTYPYFLDINEFNNDNLFLVDGYQFTEYSFWRIDTQLANTNWFIDPNMADDYLFYAPNLSPKNYVCSLNNIPNKALKLFNFDRNRYVNKSPFISYYSGVATIRPYKNDFDSLVPDYAINNYIQWKIKN